MPHDETWPQISIVTPSYNQGEFIEETIRSVLLQAYPAVEYIIIDGGSTDESVEIIKKYEPWLSHWVSEPDRGQSHGINKGLALATGKILAWLNSDDYLLPGALRAVAEAYGKAPDAGGWFGICQRVTRDGGLISVRHPNRLDLEGLADKSQNWVMQPACFFSAEVWKICGPLDTSLSFAMDFDLWLKIAGNRRIEKIDAVLAAARVHEDAKTRAQRGIMFAEIWTVQVRHGFERMAISQMAGLWEEHQELLDKTYKVQSFFPCRLIRPLVKPFLKRIFS
ncbi:MAG: glycosyltransferase family 2 protein [Thermodesulfobacteriota bacterium]|nr:glycosyltransferase family 2 protein [Thermodesulfobacteriota bacterium]